MSNLVGKLTDTEINGNIVMFPKMTASLGIPTAQTGGTKSHTDLYDRSLPDQHPISAISGLQEELDTIPKKGDYLTEDDLDGAISQALAEASASGKFDGKDGKDGVSATHKWNGTTLIITSASGTSSADLKGEKGDRGEQGLQGIQGEKGEKGDRGLQGIQGIQGERGLQGERGATGATGAKGDKGDKGDTGAKGKDGADGYTPIKGTDYFTDADKAEMVSEVLAAIPVYNGEVVIV